MAEDYTGIISFVLSIIFGAYCLHSFFSGYNGLKNYAPITDNFKIGYIDSEKQKNLDHTTVQNNENKRLKDRMKDLECLVDSLKKELQKNPQKVYAQKKNKPKESENPLQKECSLALQAVGYKTKEADKVSKDFLNHNEVKSVQEFIIKFFKDKK